MVRSSCPGTRARAGSEKTASRDFLGRSYLEPECRLTAASLTRCTPAVMAWSRFRRTDETSFASPPPRMGCFSDSSPIADISPEIRVLSGARCLLSGNACLDGAAASCTPWARGGRSRRRVRGGVCAVPHSPHPRQEVGRSGFNPSRPAGSERKMERARLTEQPASASSAGWAYPPSPWALPRDVGYAATATSFGLLRYPASSLTLQGTARPSAPSPS